ncbi:MAG: hypothetical protein P0Y50_07090 [Candidatus Brevundimonas colombiensis]|uniref:Secreted protein n=1 Tax=Candidatus Brevundimonas colombiensis TaxID=3121376 RepID=A0AAJ5WZN2_9CAUL|nr:hypothetical protein [Brevundimonas sp.]WEK41366.1 MAG: hypothetical protein P0Y50_07090 [Brevundimonas sp.]
MNKMLAVASSIAAITLFGAASASAADFATAPGTYRAEGDLVLYQTIPNVSCHVTMDIAVDAAGNAKTTSVVFSPGNTTLCGSLIRPLTTNWDLVKISSGVNTGQFQFQNVSVQAGAGTCTGTLTPLTLNWGGANQIAATTALVSGSPTVCQVSGVLDVTQISGASGPLRMP